MLDLLCLRCCRCTSCGVVAGASPHGVGHGVGQWAFADGTACGIYYCGCVGHGGLLGPFAGGEHGDGGGGDVVGGASRKLVNGKGMRVVNPELMYDVLANRGINRVEFLCGLSTRGE